VNTNQGVLFLKKTNQVLLFTWKGKGKLRTFSKKQRGNRVPDTYNALGKISCHELEEADLGDIHVLPVVVLLPLPAALTPLLCNHLPKSNHATESQLTSNVSEDQMQSERERYLHHDLVAFSERI
jgi:hypothetical protein